VCVCNSLRVDDSFGIALIEEEWVSQRAMAEVVDDDRYNTATVFGDAAHQSIAIIAPFEGVVACAA
jgi:Ni,Fe-hydrogenase maturation factor